MPKLSSKGKTPQKRGVLCEIFKPKNHLKFPFFTPLGWFINFVAEVSRVNPLGGKNATLDTPSKKFTV